MAIRDRTADVLERTLQSYACQTLAATDKILLDYGSRRARSSRYRALSDRYGWRYVRVFPEKDAWSLSAAYNCAVAALDEAVRVVLKSDVDVLVGRDVVETAAVLGGRQLCLFSCLAAPEGTQYPPTIAGHGDILALLNAGFSAMAGEGIHAFPRDWFESVGGYDLAFEGWGYEDSDLRFRANRTIGTIRAPICLLVHQWHSRAPVPAGAEANQRYYESTKADGTVVRNSGRSPRQLLHQLLKRKRKPRPSVGSGGTTAPPRDRIAVATRSMNEDLFRLSGEFVALPGVRRHRITGTDAVSYFAELLRIDADWVVNLDEDAFLLRPEAIGELISRMADGGYAACGIPDGGVTYIRRHNPVVCNACFNVFDMRRVRRAWAEFDRARNAVHQPRYEALVPNFARRGPLAFDRFEPYYGLFFSLLEAGERILYLGSRQWSDGITTVIDDHLGRPLLLHCWYTRMWTSDAYTRARYSAAAEYARSRRNGEAETSVASRLGNGAGRWESVYVRQAEPRPFGDSVTYRKAATYLGGLRTVEDWGCGTGWFRRNLPPTTRYKGVDGSRSQFADEVVNLTRYTSKPEGLLLRHVLEHNYDWCSILDNAVRSFTRRMALVLFTPFSEATHELMFEPAFGVPILSFAKEDLVSRFSHLKWSVEENLKTETQFGIEHVFYLEK